MGANLFEPLDQKNIVPTVIDVGARNGLFSLPRGYAEKSHFIGFEPNPVEYQKLVSRNTDAMKLGYLMPKFKSEKYYDCALWNEEGEFPFYVTKGAGAATMMGEALSSITKQMWLSVDKDNYEDTHAKVIRKIMTKCRRLDQILSPDAVVDFLKLDTEGADALILEGSERLLKNRNILFIKTEFQLFPYYKNHKILGDQQLQLNQYGYRLIGFDWEHPGYTREKTHLPAYADRPMLYAGDAYFILDPDQNELPGIIKHRMGLISLALGFNSLALSLFKDAGLVEEKILSDAERLIPKNYFRKKLRSQWEKIPSQVGALIAKLTRSR